MAKAKAKAKVTKKKVAKLTPKEEKALKGADKLNIEEMNKKERELYEQGKPVECATREYARVHPKVCQQIQKTDSCTHPDCIHFDTSIKRGVSPKKATGPKKLSYQDLIRIYMEEHGVATIHQLVNFINKHDSRKHVERKADAKNVSVGVSILGNKNRMKKPFRTIYDRTTKLYFWPEHPDYEKLQKEYAPKAAAEAEDKKDEAEATA